MNENGGPAPGGEAPAELELRYRRLLRLFPARYRRDREEELLGVLLAAATPGQRRPSHREAAALLGQAGRVWAQTAVSPDRAANHRAGGVLAVLLPLALIYPIGRTALSVLTTPWSFLTANHPDLGAWGLWGLAAVAALIGPAGWVRWPAAAGTGWFAVVLVTEGAAGQTGTISNGFGYLAVEVIACALMADPQRVRDGRRVLRPHWWAIPVAFILVVALLRLPGVPVIHGFFWPAVVLTVVLLIAGLACLLTPTGRAVLTVGSPLFAAFIAGHGWYTGVGAVALLIPATNRPDPMALLWLPVLPTITWAVLRAVNAAITRWHGQPI